MSTVSTTTTQNTTTTTVTDSKTSRGTLIKTGKEADKNMFVKLLSAQLANQDPSNPADSTQYVSQMAQFSALEQMANLNSTMTYMSATNLIGKQVITKITDNDGYAIQGKVVNVSKNGDTIKLKIDSYDNDINFSDIIRVDNGV